MFKDYYLILGIGRSATANDVEVAFKHANEKLNSNETSANDFEEIKEAFAILSQPAMRERYDKELDAYNEAEDFTNYAIRDQVLADAISEIQVPVAPDEDPSDGCFDKIGKGCIWVVVVIIITIMSQCVGAIMKQQGRNSVKNGYSYVSPVNK